MSAPLLAQALSLLAALALLLTLSLSALAAPGGNSANAKACQKGGWETLARAEDNSIAFLSEEACVSYAAEGGTLVPFVAVVLTRCEQEAVAAGIDLVAWRASLAGHEYSVIGGTDGSDDLTNRGTPGPDLICGFGGNDIIAVMDASDIFLGGDGDDTVGTLRGTFYGGAGSDRVDLLEGGTFYGGDGDDGVDSMYGGTFNGGPGLDEVAILTGGGTFNQD